MLIHRHRLAESQSDVDRRLADSLEACSIVLSPLVPVFNRPYSPSVFISYDSKYFLWIKDSSKGRGRCRLSCLSLSLSSFMSPLIFETGGLLVVSSHSFSDHFYFSVVIFGAIPHIFFETRRPCSSCDSVPLHLISLFMSTQSHISSFQLNPNSILAICKS